MRRLPIALLCFLPIVATLLPHAAWAKSSVDFGEPLRLEVPNAPDAYYFKPSSKGTKPVVMYLHGRGGNPAADCKKWARVATAFGWVVCPSGPGDADSGGRTWSTGAGDAQRIIDATVNALRAKYKSRVQRHGNVLIGFSEGAFIAMQVGLKDQSTWNKWLILAASDQYWGGIEAEQWLDKDKRKVRRVYLLTGENDGVAQNTVRVGEVLKKNNVRVIVKIIPNMGHEVPSDRMISTYRRPLLWLIRAK
ncbi:MAG: hypothetical protein FWD73_04595 [Polyangiaceae bacterium]|nr:hypothetical protein [Polyangiaceae bacterium]